MIKSMRMSVVRGCWLAVIVGALGVGVATVAATSEPAGSVEARGAIPQRVLKRPVPVRRAAFAPATAVAAFGLDLMRAQARGNLVFSPDSIAAALAMAGSGAAGATATQIAHVLHVKSPHAFAAVGQLQGTIAGEQRAAAAGDPQAATLDLANAMFLQHGFTPAASFLVGLHRHFGSTAPQSVDFRQPSAVEAINTWVSAHTQGVIPHVLTELPPQTLLALVNAIYLKAAWLHPFKPAATAPAPFHGERESSSMAFMQQTEELHYSHGKGYAAVDLPYRASTLSLLVVLPVGQSVATLQRRLDPSQLARIVRGLAPRPVRLSVPRFHLATHIELDSSLESLGMPDAFSARANFSGITKAQALQLGVVDHAADFTVEEQGTIAAAATIVTAEPTAERVFVPAPIPFDANRPFLFFLRDDHSGAVLFAGRMTEPASAPAQP